MGGAYIIDPRSVFCEMPPWFLAFATWLVMDRSRASFCSNVVKKSRFSSWENKRNNFSKFYRYKIEEKRYINRNIFFSIEFLIETLYNIVSYEELLSRNKSV